MNDALMRGDEIKRLLPQRAPILMVETLYSATETEAETGLTLAVDNMFIVNGRFREPGLVEHIAQSASALAGYNAYKKNLPAPIGYIGEVKKCKILRLPEAGDELRTRLQIVSEVNGVSLLKADTLVDGEVIATTNMKIFIEA